ncbi:GIY-YIG nuclease family protein [Nocardioides sp. SLBN-35]|uniref:GIY-YIG nuclease family protein n=1 Tax=Nocardioides sp. SLBN-35 TaxID=2768445 RepID=UPI001152CDE8|nr:GIY-YIG nuclease family protein [Nocardioides sp. SLBN-35]TQK69912.1 GIY-YIG catalytic domain-containing protein [Nocardioides sp. SLBN-35]
MTLTASAIFASAGLDPTDAMVIRHAYVRERGNLHPDSTDAEILEYTRVQSSNPRIFPAAPPPYWVVFRPEGGDRARLWAVLRYNGEEACADPSRRVFNLEVIDLLDDLRDRLVIGWRSPRTWWIWGTTAAVYPIVEIADSQPIRFPGFDALTLDYPQLQAVLREHRYAAWRTALSSVIGIYLITDTRDGRHYVGKADGAENLLQRWAAYATNGHGGNVELRSLDPTTFRLSVLRVFDPATPTLEINAAEGHFKHALDSRRHGLNRN